ncbi:MAG: spore coat U domain-containing protein [Siculibacillus sp.]|nr:spore coat U domain-containing protein [Siculibacillus sp.]
MLGPALVVSASLVHGEAEAGCSIGSFAMVFSSLDILSGSSLDSTGTFSVSCSLGLNTSSNIGISCGAGTSCTSNQRHMVNTTNSAHKLRVEFYTNSGRTNVWPASPATPAGSYTGSPYAPTIPTNGTKNFTVYGRIAANQQTAPPGTYVWTGNPDPKLLYCTDLLCLFTATDTPPSASTATVTIPAFCSVGTSSSVAFGTAGVLSSAVDATGTVRVTCTNTTSYSVGLDTGSNASGSTRRMKHASATSYVVYELYLDSTRSTVWSTSGGNLKSGTGTGTQQSHTVYGRVPSQSPAPTPGSYADTVAVTVTY